jgi:GT2 family glycosyltransferase
MIPVLVVPVLNGYDLLYRMFDSIDHPIEHIIVIDNGGHLSDELPVLPCTIVSLPHNLGVGASWNLGMKLTPQAPWWLIANHDLEWGPGDLERIEAGVDRGFGGIYFSLGMAAFALTRYTLGNVGYFDENIHPAYDEDLDFARRIDLLGLPRVELGFTGTHVGSATIYADPSLRAQNGPTHMANDLYYAKKWGGHKEGGETFSTPFNRGGHVGEWRLDPERLRTQAWRR